MLEERAPSLKQVLSFHFPKLPMSCRVCGVETKSCCTGCHSVLYCSEACQRKGAETHEKDCAFTKKLIQKALADCKDMAERFGIPGSETKSKSKSKESFIPTRYFWNESRTKIETCRHYAVGLTKNNISTFIEGLVRRLSGFNPGEACLGLDILVTDSSTGIESHAIKLFLPDQSYYLQKYVSYPFATIGSLEFHQSKAK